MSGATVLDLGGRWRLRQPERGITVAARVPGDVHTALVEAGVLPEPYHGCHVEGMRWVGEVDWELATTFRAGPEWAGRDRVFLEFDAIDTVARVLLNGVEVGVTDNVFRRHRCDVRGVWREGDNELEVRISAAARVAAERAARRAFPLRQGPYIRTPHMNLLRKVQCHGGWDWGPELLQHGIPGGVRLVGADGFLLEEVETRQEHGSGGGAVTVTVTAWLEVLVPGAAVAVAFAFDGAERTVEAVLEPGRRAVSCAFEVTAPRLWWPQGYGAPALYPLAVRAGGQVVEKRLGLRTVELVRERDEVGTTFGFRVNGVDVFCGGANWVPCDALWSRQTEAVYRRLVDDARAAGMNLLRVWGGGRYEAEAFYDACDEAGLLVWQDLMFACAPYPAEPEFLAGVREEVRQQVARLRDRACLALWCGGNELLGSGTFKRQAAENPGLYLVNYDRLARVLAETVAAADPGRPYWPTSPCRGPDDLSGWWYDDTAGDTHFWDVGTGFYWKPPQDFDAYLRIRPRFASEFGVLGFSDPATIRSFCPDDRAYALGSRTLRAHEQWRPGDRGVLEMILAYFRLPESFEEILHLGQVVQAMGVARAVEFWRSTAPRCRGALYWQLNDVWPMSAGWSGLDHAGRWKLLHHHAARFLDPLLVAGVADPAGGRLRICAVAEGRGAVAARVRARLFGFDGALRRTESWEAVLEPGRAVVLADRSEAEWTDDPEGTFLHLELSPAPETDGAGDWGARPAARVRENTVLFRRPRDLALPDPVLAWEVGTTSGGAVAVTLRAVRPAFWVAVRAGADAAGRFSDNGVTVLPGEPRTLVWHPRGPAPDPAGLAAGLRVHWAG